MGEDVAPPVRCTKARDVLKYHTHPDFRMGFTYFVHYCTVFIINRHCFCFHPLTFQIHKGYVTSLAIQSTSILNQHLAVSDECTEGCQVLNSRMNQLSLDCMIS